MVSMEYKQVTARPWRGNLHKMYRPAYYILRPIIDSVAKLRWSGVENFPKDGPFIVAPNHISNFDPVSMGYFVGINGYELRFLAKDSLFKVPVLGPFLLWWGMIPVMRDSSEAGDALRHAREALDEGAVIGFYFEGTLTRDPAFWPMKGKTGLARLALDTRVPIIPIVQWGAQDVMDRYNGLSCRWKRPTMYFQVLPAIEYGDIEGDSSNREGVRELTARIQEALGKGSEMLRGQKAPEQPWDMKAHDGPDRKVLSKFSHWRRSLAKANRRQDILAAVPGFRAN